MPRVEAAEPLGKETDHTQTPRPRVRVRPAERLLPSQEEIGADALGGLPFREGDESAQDPCGRREVVSEMASDCQIAVEILSPDAHGALPTRGQGCAIERRPSTSSLA
jgi:hypothetical protein